jgi:3-dehydroquinate synthase
MSTNFQKSDSVIHIESSRGGYDVELWSECTMVVERIGGFINDHKPSSVVVFSNPLIWDLYGHLLGSAFEDSVFVVSYLFPDGEEHKNLQSIHGALTFLDQHPLDRKTVFIALGGGVVGDMTGFVSSIFLRGVDWIQVPTTLLAMVDSSVGGKTGVNLPNGKNRVGSFYPPNLVCSSPEFLKTLAIDEIKSGLGEVIKHGVLSSHETVRRIHQTLEVSDWRHWYVQDDIADLISLMCSIKGKIVQTDEFESGNRAWLNFGHSVGHAIERCLNYHGILHGQAVLFGMLIESEWTLSQGWTKSCVVDALKKSIKYIDMSIEIDDNVSRMTMFDAISFDKKMQCDKLQLVVVQDFGLVHMRALNRDEILSLASFATEFLIQYSKSDTL